MNIVCTICRDLLIPSSDVYNTPCGHIFHFQCLIRWLERSKTCPQCREKATERSIHRIYFNFPNDDSIYQFDSVKLQDEINALNFKLTLAKKKVTGLEATNNILESQVDLLQQTIKQMEEIIKKKDSAITALKTQIQHLRVTCKDVTEKDKEIKMLNMKLEKLQNIQDILNCSAHEVDKMLEQFTYQDISKLQTFVSVLKRELENSIAQKRRLREKASAKSRADAEVLIIRNKLRKLEETLKNENKIKANLQAELLEMQTAACNSKCNKCGKTTAVEKKSQDECKNSKVVPIETKCTSNPNSSETLEVEKDNDCIAADNMENTPQNIKSRGFFSMTNCGIKRTSNSVTVPSILAKKINSKNSRNLFEVDQLKKKTVGSGMTFDGFGGHGKYDKFPKST